MISGGFVCERLHDGNKCGEQIDKKRPQAPEDLADIVAASAQHGEDGFATQPFEGASYQVTVTFHV